MLQIGRSLFLKFYAAWYKDFPSAIYIARGPKTKTTCTKIKLQHIVQCSRYTAVTITYCNSLSDSHFLQHHLVEARREC